MIDVACVSSTTPTWSNDPRWCTPGIAATEAEHGKLPADRASSAPVQGVHRYYPFVVEDRGRLGKSALTVVYIFAVLLVVRNFPGVPQLYFKHALAKHCDAAKQHALADCTHAGLNIKLSGSKAGQPKTCASKIDLSAETWHGDTCSVLMENYVAILQLLAVPQWRARDKIVYNNAIKVWELFFKLHHETTHDNSNQTVVVEAHAAEAEQRRSQMLSAYLQMANKKDVITTKGATLRAWATVKVAAKHAASGVARTKFTREYKSKASVQKHVDVVKALGLLDTK
eukprot:jgi/Tetstr1/447403/TSEL_034839.t1